MKSFKFKPFVWITDEDIEQASNILRSNNLSGFLATEGVERLGGYEVRKLESSWSAFEETKYSVAFNSWTSGLEASIQALNLPIGSEVITTPWTMSATTAVIVNSGLRPRFVDINPRDFNISIEKTEKAISKTTSAILAVDIFGYPCDSPSLRELCKESGLSLIIDSAQTPLARIFGKKPSYHADVSGYSFNRHKHLQSGEGGIAVTNNNAIYSKLVALRNHAEVSHTQSKVPLPGRNLRFGEVESFLISRQLERVEAYVDFRRRAASRIIEELKNSVLEPPEIAEGIDHDFYILGFKLPLDFGHSRREFLARRLREAGLPFVLEKYVLTHKLPSFKRFSERRLTNAETLQGSCFLGLYMCGVDWSEDAVTFTSETIKACLN